MTTETPNREWYPEVRVLTRKDRKKLSDLIRAFADKSGNSEITKMLPKADGGGGKDEGKEKSTDEVYELIKTVMAGLFQWVEEDVTAWFMDLIGVVDRDAYDNMPFDIEVYIIDEMMKQKGFSNFFSKASELYRKVRGSIG